MYYFYLFEMRELERKKGGGGGEERGKEEIKEGKRENYSKGGKGEERMLSWIQTWNSTW